MVTPLLSSLRKNGGTLYTFSSAAKDLTRIFTNSQYKFSFSHFACLNLPDIKEVGTDKGLYLGKLLDMDEFNNNHTYDKNGDKIDSAFNDNDNINLLLAENIQNYIMNFETTILNGLGDNDNYNNEILRSPSERIFFNWLQKVGSIKFKQNGNFFEEDDEYKNRVVKYIGKIDIINSVDVLGESFDEVYLYIPGSCGGSNSVKFISQTDDNYDNKNYTSITENDVIVGRNKNLEHPYGLSIKSIYDDKNEKIYKGDNGYCIDFRDDSYDGGIDVMNSNSKDDFEFNTVLIYYTLEKDGIYTQNLYGVLFLDNITNINSDDNEQDVSKGYIMRYPKICGGNSYALKVNLKVDTLPDTTLSPKDYIDPNDDYAGALEIYTQSLLKIQSLATKLIDDKNRINELNERIEYLENQLSLINQIPSIINNINKLENLIYYSDTVVNGQSLLDLINKNSLTLSNLIEGKTNAKLVVDGNAIKGGYGINVNADNNGFITIDNKIGLYNIVNFYKNIDLTDDSQITDSDNISLYSDNGLINIYSKISDGNNYGVLYVKDSCNADFVINIQKFNWKSGQSLKIKIKHENNYFTGEETKLKTTAIPLIKINCIDNEGNDNFITKYEPIKAYEVNGLESIEIICINENATEPHRKFIYDIKVK